MTFMPPMFLSSWVEAAHANSKAHGFYDDPNQNPAEKVALMHSELSELLEALRKDPAKPSEKCPTITCEAEELADLLIRAFDYAGWRGIDLQAAVQVKHEYNVRRPHKHGKKF